jgi:hypothetical protein
VGDEWLSKQAAALGSSLSGKKVQRCCLQLFFGVSCLTSGTSSMVIANATMTTTSLSTTTPITRDTKGPLASISFSTAICIPHTAAQHAMISWPLRTGIRSQCSRLALLLAVLLPLDGGVIATIVRAHCCCLCAAAGLCQYSTD